jgi:hypothetical protein
MMKKTFDCVEMKRIGAERIYRELKDKTVEEQIAYWRKGTTDLIKRIEEEKKEKAALLHSDGDS